MALQESGVYNWHHCFSKLAIWGMTLQQANDLHADTWHAEVTWVQGQSMHLLEAKPQGVL